MSSMIMSKTNEQKSLSEAVALLFSRFAFYELTAEARQTIFHASKYLIARLFGEISAEGEEAPKNNLSKVATILLELAKKETNQQPLPICTCDESLRYLRGVAMKNYGTSIGFRTAIHFDCPKHGHVEFEPKINPLLTRYPPRNEYPPRNGPARGAR